MKLDKTRKNSGLDGDAYLDCIVYTSKVKRRYRNLYLTFLEQAKYPELDFLQKVALEEMASVKVAMTEVSHRADITDAQIYTKLEGMRTALFKMILMYHNFAKIKKAPTNNETDPFEELWNDEENQEIQDA